MLKLTILVLIILADAYKNGFCIHYLDSETAVPPETDKPPIAPARDPYIDCVQNMSTNERGRGFIDQYCGGCSVNMQSVQVHINSSCSNRVKYEQNDNKCIGDHILFYHRNCNGRYDLNTINMSHMTDVKFISDTKGYYLPQYTWYNKICPMSNMSKGLTSWSINDNYIVNTYSAKTTEYLDEANIGGISVACCLILIFGLYIKWKYLWLSHQDVDIELKYGESLSPPVDWKRDDNVTTSIPQQTGDNGHFEYPPWAEYAFIDQVEGRQDIEVNPEPEAININLMPPENNDIHQDDGQFEYPPWAEYSNDL